MNTDNLKNELDNFLNEPTTLGQVPTDPDVEVVITPKTGLVERIEKKLVTADGRQLLTERLY